MIATSASQISLPGSRPAFRVLCAWCEQPIKQVKPAATVSTAALTRTSHGICKPCALLHFGFDLETLSERQLRA
jgi:hypothetical protein